MKLFKVLGFILKNPNYKKFKAIIQGVEQLGCQNLRYL